MSAKDVPLRAQVLREAEALILGDRNLTYGDPSQNFVDIAALWTVLLRPKLRDGAVVEPHETAMLMAALKLARLIVSPEKRDNWTDGAGYMGCGYEAYEASREEAPDGRQ